MITAVIVAGYDFAANGVTGPFEKTALCLGEVAGVLVESHRQNGLRQHVANGLIGVSASIVLNEPFCPLPQGRILALCHGRAGKDAGDQKGRRIEGVIKCELEFLPWGQRSELRSAVI